MSVILCRTCRRFRIYKESCSSPCSPTTRQSDRCMVTYVPDYAFQIQSFWIFGRMKSSSVVFLPFTIELWKLRDATRRDDSCSHCSLDKRKTVHSFSPCLFSFLILCVESFSFLESLDTFRCWFCSLQSLNEAYSLKGKKRPTKQPPTKSLTLQFSEEKNCNCIVLLYQFWIFRTCNC